MKVDINKLVAYAQINASSLIIQGQCQPDIIQKQTNVKKRICFLLNARMVAVSVIDGARAYCPTLQITQKGKRDNHS